MLKTATQTALIALSLVAFGTGCDLADLINLGGGGSVVEPYPEPYPEPTPEPTPAPDDCEAQLDQCLTDIWGDDLDIARPDYYDPTTGPAEEACFDAFDVCIDVSPPPPPPICEIELDDCLAAIYGGDDTPPPTTGVPVADQMPIHWDPEAEQACFDAYDDCTGVQPPPPPIDDCDLELDRCLMDLADPDLPVDPNDPTFLPIDQQFCFDQYAICIDDTVPPPPPVSPCDQLFDDCVDNGVSLGLCEAVYDECLAPPEPPSEPGYPGDDDGTDSDEPTPTP